MKIIYNNIIPFKGFSCINICGILFVRKGIIVTDRLLNHENIHTVQMKELWYILFYIIYLFEWIIKLIYYRNFKLAYRAISFEREAYLFEKDYYYLKFYRLKFASFKYLFLK